MLNEKQREALRILHARHESGKPIQWVWPKSVGMKPSTFGALERRGLAEKRYNSYHAAEYRLIPVEKRY